MDVNTKKISSFGCLNITQFLGALNDNIYKLLIAFFLIDRQGLENSHTILALTGAMFVLPFLLFSSFAGIMADRYSKRNIICFTKILEFIISFFGIIVFWTGSQWGAYCILFLLGVQTSLFVPSKYGILPELVPAEKISKSNGIMSSFTFLAIILGTFFASFLLDVTGKNFILASIFCTIIAFVGVLSSFRVDYTLPSGSMKKLTLLPFREVKDTLWLASQYPSLLMAVFGSAFFMFIGAFVQLNMIPFATQSLGLSDTQGGYLFLLTALGIGTGAMVAGKISGKMVELGLAPVAALGLGITCYGIESFSYSLYYVIPLVVTLGFFGGIYEIPLDSYIQVASPKKSRGQMVATTNFLSYFGVLIASSLIYITGEILKFTPEDVFGIIGTISLFMTIIIGFQYFDYLTRFVGMLLSRIHFKTTYYGLNNIPDTPVIYVSTHNAWNDTLLILGSQRRRVRFFIQQEQDHSSKLMRRLYAMLRVVFIPSIEPLEKNEECLLAIKKILNKGFSVCIFVDHLSLEEELYKLEHSYSFRKILDETHYPIIPVTISKVEKHVKSPIFSCLIEKIRVPASIAFNLIIPAVQPVPEEFEDDLCLAID